LAFLAAAGAAYWLVLHIAVGLGFAALLAGAVWLGMLVERRRTAQPQPREPQPVRNARSLAQQLRHARGQVETLTGKLADEMQRNDRSQA
jgi:hypothetical protein